MRIYERIWIYCQVSWCKGKIVGLELGRPFDWFVGFGAHFLWDLAGAQLSYLYCGLLGGVVTEVISVNPVASLRGTSSFPTCLSTGVVKWAWVLVLCLALLRFRVWLRTSPCLHQIVTPGPSQLQSSVAALNLKENTLLNHLCTTEYLIKLH